MMCWEIKTAGPIMGRALRRFGFAGVVTPWKRVYILPEHADDIVVLSHEMAHIRQIERDGAWRFWLRCLFYFLWHGHRDSPIEIEARAMAEKDIGHGTH